MLSFVWAEFLLSLLLLCSGIQFAQKKESGNFVMMNRRSNWHSIMEQKKTKVSIVFKSATLSIRGCSFSFSFSFVLLHPSGPHFRAPRVDMQAFWGCGRGPTTSGREGKKLFQVARAPGRWVIELFYVRVSLRLRRSTRLKWTTRRSKSWSWNHTRARTKLLDIECARSF